MALTQDVVVRLLLSHRASLLGYIRSIVRDMHLAEDIFQDVSVIAVSKREEISNESHFGGWIRKAARYESLHALRQRDNEPTLMDTSVLDLLEPHWSAVDSHRVTDVSEGLRYCLEQLSPYSRELIEHRYAQGQTGPDLAKAMNREVNTVYVALSRAHNSLAECMQKRMDSEGGGQ